MDRIIYRAVVDFLNEDFVENPLRFLTPEGIMTIKSVTDYMINEWSTPYEEALEWATLYIAESYNKPFVSCI